MAQMVYEQGKSTIKTETNGFGIVPGSAENRFGYGQMSTAGTQQTELSKRAAPPFGLGLSTLLASAAVVFAVLGCRQPAWFVLAVPCAAGLVFVLPREMREHAERLAVWRQTVMCRRCGIFYVPRGREW